jgi:subtilisin family serine protease
MRSPPNFVLTFCTLLSLLFAGPCQPAYAARVDPAIAQQGPGVEFEITATLLPDGPPRPFSKPLRVRTEEGRAWVRSIMADLRRDNAESVYELGDGVVWAKLRPGNGMRIVGELASHPRVERVDLSRPWRVQMREGLDAAGIHYAASMQYLSAFGPTFAANIDVVVIDAAFDIQHPALTSQAGIPDIREYCACGRSSGPGQPVVGCCPNGSAFQEGPGLGLVPPGAHGFNLDFHGTAVASVIRSSVGLNVPLNLSDPGLPYPNPALPFTVAPTMCDCT